MTTEHPEDRDMQEFVEAPTIETGARKPVSVEPGRASGGRPERVGKYRIIDTLGEGGMGEVYLAEETGAVRRRVALKLIKLGMDTREVVARFESERQALAMMSHPCIARVYDAGATETGRPYFVMEHVQGVPITEYCDMNKLDTEARLGLVLEVCDAIQHAHQKGIIHRDIKPSNVLIAMQDGKPTPKVIDFGVAKATHARLTERSLFTEQGQIIGTPEYMSPEQAEMSGLDVDTRTDIYSLGVLMYELLCGTLPFDSKELRSVAYGEIQRRIREVDPPKPSTKLSALDRETTHAVASRRDTDFGGLQRQLKGDLDWITMRAMEKDRTRRYASAAGLASDIQRHLDHEPVVAGPPSATYKVSKFVRRNRAGVAAAAVVILAMIGGLVAASVGLARARAAEHQAQMSLAREVASREAADLAKAEAEAINEFLTKDLLGAAKPEQSLGRELTVREALDEAAEEIDGAFVDQPLVEASVRMTLGSTYSSLGKPDLAQPHVERALEIRTNELGESHEKTRHAIRVRNDLRITMHEAEEDALREQVATNEKLLGDRHIETVKSRNALAGFLVNSRRFEEAIPIQQEAVAGFIAVEGPDDKSTITAQVNLALTLERAGRLTEACDTIEIALAAQRRTLGDDHPVTLAAMQNYAVILEDLGRFEESEEIFRQTLAGRQRVLGERHPRTLATMNDLAMFLMGRERYDEARPIFEECIAISAAELGDEHPATMRWLNNYGFFLEEAGDTEGAEQVLKRTLAARRKTLGDSDPGTLVTMSNLGGLLTKQGKLEEAEALLREAVATAKQIFPPGHLYTAVFRGHYGKCLRLLGRYDESREQLTLSYGALTSRPEPDMRRVKSAAKQLALLYEATGEDALAARFREEAGDAMDKNN